MKKMLAKDPEHRYTVQQALHHDWVLSGGHFLSPNTKTPIYLNSALENMKRCQQEYFFFDKIFFLITTIGVDLM